MLFILRLAAIALLTGLLTPFLVLVAATLLFFNLVHMLTHFSRRPVPGFDARLSGLASIIILNWNGKDLLHQCLPSVVDAVAEAGGAHEIIVVDNGSSDGSCDFVRRNFPGVRLIALEENLGFAEGNNKGVRAARHDVVVLLNNDMVVDRGFLRPLLDGFGPNTFAVTSQIFLQDRNARREETGKTTAAFRRGMIDYSHAPLDGRELRRPYYPAFWAGGGSSAFHRARFLALGGFSEIYSPAYVEDADLSYMAWRVGWDVLFAPASIVHHRHRASSRRRFSAAELQVLIQRNQLLFIWKNIRSWRLLLSHCALLPWTCFRIARDHGIGIWRSVLQAALEIPDLETDRLGTPFRRERTDVGVFGIFRNPARYFRQSGRTGPDRPETRPSVLWVTAYIPHAGRHAGAARMYQLLRCLACSYRITLLSFLETEEEREFALELAPLCEGVEVMRRSPPPRWQLFPYEPFDEFRTDEMTEAVRRRLEDQDFALIQLEYSQMGCYADIGLGIPTLITKHEVDFAACARRARVERNLLHKVRWFYNYLQVLDREVRLLRGVDAAICMTEPDAVTLRRFCRGLPIHVVNTGVDLDYFTPAEQRESSPRLVFVGAFQHHPNVDAILYFTSCILPLIREDIPKAEFVIVGSNPPPSITSLADQPGVVVTGFVPDIRPFMASSAVYVVPLRLGVGIRGKILEAWSMAMPVVATTVACAGLRCQHGTNLLIADDEESFAKAVVSLVNNPLARERLGREGRKVAEAHYGWESAASQLRELYERYQRVQRMELPVQKEASRNP